jgi:uncharacterized coiled-coil DUF342 family protein
MNRTRKIYERRAEIWTKKLLARIYDMEARAMETQLNVQKGLDKVNDQIDWDARVKKLAEERENLTGRFQDMINSSNEKWKEFSTSFENYFNQVTQNRMNITERATDWVNEANSWLNDWDERAKNYNLEMRNKFREQMDTLRSRRDQLNDKLSQIRTKGSEQVDNVGKSLEADINNIQSTITNLIQHYRKEDKSEGDQAK